MSACTSLSYLFLTLFSLSLHKNNLKEGESWSQTRWGYKSHQKKKKRQFSLYTDSTLQTSLSMCTWWKRSNVTRDEVIVVGPPRGVLNSEFQKSESCQSQIWNREHGIQNYRPLQVLPLLQCCQVSFPHGHGDLLKAKVTTLRAFLGARQHLEYLIPWKLPRTLKHYMEKLLGGRTAIVLVLLIQRHALRLSRVQK